MKERVFKGLSQVDQWDGDQRCLIVTDSVPVNILSHPANINDRLPCRPPAIGDCRNRMNAKSQEVYAMARWLPAPFVRNILISEPRLC